SNPLDEFLETLVVSAFAHIPGGHTLDDFGNVLRGYRADGEAVRSGVVFPLSTNDYLEMRHLSIADRSAGAVETEVRNVMLTARVNAPADFDMQILYSFIQREELVRKTRANFSGQTSRGSDSEFARVGSRARRNVHDGSCSCFREADTREFPIKVYKVCFAN